MCRPIFLKVLQKVRPMRKYAKKRFLKIRVHIFVPTHLQGIYFCYLAPEALAFFFTLAKQTRQQLSIKFVLISTIVSSANSTFSMFQYEFFQQLLENINNERYYPSKSALIENEQEQMSYKMTLSDNRPNNSQTRFSTIENSY